MPTKGAFPFLNPTTLWTFSCWNPPFVMLLGSSAESSLSLHTTILHQTPGQLRGVGWAQEVTPACCFSPALSTACSNVFLAHFCPVHNNPVINTLSSFMLYRQQLAEWKQNSFWSYHFVLLTIKKYIKMAYVHFTSLLNTNSNTNSFSSQTRMLFHSVFRSSRAVIT